jgi:hypothetical protein
MSITLNQSLQSWNTQGFGKALCTELSFLQPGSLPLHKATTLGGLVDDSDISVIFLRASEDTDFINAEVDVFFTEVFAGCSCGDEPMPVHAHCELIINIDKRSAAASINLR